MIYNVNNLSPKIIGGNLKVIPPILPKARP